MQPRHPILVALIVTLGAASPGEAEPPAMTTVDSVDLDRYAGLWHEVARIPNRFQKQCESGVTAEYSLRDDGRISVVNRCVREDGSTDEARGIARIVPASGNSKLQVSFFSILGWRPVWGDYWVLGLGPDYDWVVVGEPDRKYGWVLARSTEVDEATLQQIVSVIETNGYEWSAFQMGQP